MKQALPLPTFSWTQSLSFPLLQLLHPRQYTGMVLKSLALGLVVGWLAVYFLAWPLWAATFVVLVALLPAGIRKWHADLLVYGPTVMLLSILLTTQGLHSIEHLIQWAQYHILYWTARQSTGLLSPANAEWVHFIWNWSVLIVVVLLIKGGMRNIWAYALLTVAILHTFEHTYTFVRYLQVLRELRGLGVTNIPAQGLPGIVGQDGWLARSPWTRGTILCSVTGLTTAVRLDVHFWWNVLEMTMLAVAGHFFLRRTTITNLSNP